MHKQTVLKIAVTLVFGVLSLPAFAQNPAITVNIPFSFQMDNHNYPAGEYGFTTIREGVVVLTKDGRINQGLSLANHVVSQRWDGRSAQVRFQCYDRQCFLSQVWIPGMNDGLELRRSQAEEELATKGAGKYLALLGTPARR